MIYKTENIKNFITDIYGDFYDLSKLYCKKSSDKVIVICPWHGEIKKSAQCLVEMCVCKECNRENNFIESINNAKKLHNNKYDYSKVDITLNKKEKHAIICPEHGTFYQSWNNHTHKTNLRGCPKCAIEARRRFFAAPQEDFLKKAIEIHGDKYDYSKVEYVNCHTKVILICPLHGEFKIKPSKHVDVKQGCHKCGIIKSANSQRKTTEKFIEECKLVHGDKYDYSEIEYVNCHTKVKVICPRHGVFYPYPTNFLSHKKGCRSCMGNVSKTEKKLRKYLKSIYDGEMIFNKRNLLGNFEIDIYLPELKLAIEFNGTYWHNVDKVGKEYHKMKTDLCDEKGVRLVHIYEHDWLFRKNVIKKKLKDVILGKEIFYDSIVDMFEENDILYLLIDRDWENKNSCVGLEKEGFVFDRVEKPRIFYYDQYSNVVLENDSKMKNVIYTSGCLRYVYNKKV